MSDATDKDKTLRILRQVIFNGWPDDKCQLPQAVLPYYSYRNELSVHDGIVLRGQCVVIPRTMRNDIKQCVHAGHLGINSCLRRACDIVFWPGMSGELRQFVESCHLCNIQ